MYFLDVSGSVTDEQVIRFNSEIKYIKDVLKPKKLTLVQFDTRISHIDVFEENDSFDKLCVVGRGGTDLRPVREMILKEKPSAAVVFSDLYCAPMEPIDIPVIFVAVDNRNAAIEAVKYLISIGHKRIATITGDLKVQAGFQRLEGYKIAHERNRLPIKDEYIYIGDFAPHSGRYGVERLLELDKIATVS